MNALYEAIDTTSTNAGEASVKQVEQNWGIIRRETNVFRQDVLAAVLIYNGHMDLISQSEWEQFNEIAIKASQALKARNTPPNLAKNLFASMQDAPTL